MKIKCARCGKESEGYIRDDGASMVLHEDGKYLNSWVYGCSKCDP